jgi:hypothetical protein
MMVNKDKYLSDLVQRQIEAFNSGASDDEKVWIYNQITQYQDKRKGAER